MRSHTQSPLCRSALMSWQAPGKWEQTSLQQPPHVDNQVIRDSTLTLFIYNCLLTASGFAFYFSQSTIYGFSSLAGMKSRVGEGQSSICWFTLQLTTPAKTTLSQTPELHPGLPCGCKGQALVPLLDASAKTWMPPGVAGTQSGAPVWDDGMLALQSAA